MDKNSLSVFGWIVVVLIFIASIVALLPSFGGYLSESLFKSSGNLMNNADVARPIEVTINKSYYGEGILLRKDYFEKGLVKFIVQEYHGYIYNGATVTSDDGQVLNLDKNTTSFVLGTKNVSIELKFAGIKSSFDVSEEQDSSSTLVLYENNTAVLYGYGTPSIAQLQNFDVSSVDVVYISHTVPNIPESLFSNFTSLEKIIVKTSPEKLSVPFNSLPDGFDIKNIIYEY